jgi:glycerol-3-phosphate acyltransferase PlsY
MIETKLIIEALIAFAIGAIPFAVIAMLGSGIDIRKVGSGNPGFNNVLRVHKGRAMLTLAGDMLKGYLPVALFFQPGEEPFFLGWLLGFAAVFGHCYSPFLKFNGGKGIATSSGVMMRLFPMLALAGLGFFVLLRVAGSRFKVPEAGAIASVVTWIFFSMLTYIYVDSFAVRMSLLMTLFLTWRHKSNIRNLFD